MDQEEIYSRRTVVKLSGIAATTALVAGCADEGPDDGNDTGNGDGGAGNGDTTGNGIGGDGDDGTDGTDNETDGADGMDGTDNETDGTDNETDGTDNETDGTDNETDGEDNETDGDGAAGGEWEDVDEVVLDGYTAAWEGVEPSPIEGEDNPTLVLSEGESYDITWTNADGQPHNIEIWDDSQEVVDDYQTDIIDEEGEEQTLTIDEVTDEMAEYVCQVHVGTMIGEIDVQSGDGGDGEDNETDGGDGEDNESGV